MDPRACGPGSPAVDSMDTNHATTRPPEGEQNSEGAAVFDAAGEKVGIVAVDDRRAGFVVVEKGWLFPQNCAVPQSAIVRTDSPGVYLTLLKEDLLYQVKDDLTSLNWDPPDRVDAVSGSVTPRLREHVVDRSPLRVCESSPTSGGPPCAQGALGYDSGLKVAKEPARAPFLTVFSPWHAVCAAASSLLLD